MPNHQRIALGRGKVFSAPHLRLEGVSRCWIEEANTTRLDSWLILDPTIRVPGSQISISYNPERARLRRRGGALQSFLGIVSGPPHHHCADGDSAPRCDPRR